MNKDNVNISLTHYNTLVNAEKLAKDKAKKDIESEVKEKVKELMKHTILIKKQMAVFSIIEKIEIITNDDAFKMKMDQCSEEYMKKDNKLAELEKIYINAINLIKNVKWYDLLFSNGFKNL